MSNDFTIKVAGVCTTVETPVDVVDVLLCTHYTVKAEDVETVVQVIHYSLDMFDALHEAAELIEEIMKTGKVPDDIGDVYAVIDKVLTEVSMEIVDV